MIPFALLPFMPAVLLFNAISLVGFGWLVGLVADAPPSRRLVARASSPRPHLPVCFPRLRHHLTTARRTSSCSSRSPSALR